MIGNPEELPMADLPTRRNVLLKMLLERMKDGRDLRNIPFMELTARVKKSLRAAWMRVNHRMVVVGEKEIRRKIFSFWQVLEQISSDNKKERKN